GFLSGRALVVVVVGSGAAAFLDFLEMAACAFARSPKEMEEKSTAGSFSAGSSSLCGRLAQMRPNFNKSAIVPLLLNQHRYRPLPRSLRRHRLPPQTERRCSPS